MASKSNSSVPPASTSAPLSAGRFAAAFAKLLRGSAPADENLASDAAALPVADGSPADPSVSPAMVFEGLLFVGHPEGEPVTGEQCSAVLRGLKAADFDELAQGLNDLYRSQGRPYEVERLTAGYRLVLTDEFARLRDQLQSRSRRARLSRAALEILSLVAYRGPLTGEEIAERCGSAVSGVLRQLVRRNLLAVSRPSGERGPRSYRTTARFLEVFHLESLAELPRSQDLDPSAESP